MDALIVASTTKQQYGISDVLNKNKIDCIVCSTAAEARRAALCRPFDIFVVNGGLPDECGNELAVLLAETNDCGGVYIDEFARVDMFSDDLAQYGIIALVRPITRTALGDAIRLVAVANARVRALKEKNVELSVKLEDLKFISRAKIALMRSFGYTEEQAHKYIEKRSMELRVSRRNIAMEILKTYEGF